jgi:hypothetical protein
MVKVINISPGDINRYEDNQWADYRDYLGSGSSIIYQQSQSSYVTELQSFRNVQERPMLVQCLVSPGT